MGQQGLAAIPIERCTIPPEYLVRQHDQGFLAHAGAGCVLDRDRHRRRRAGPIVLGAKAAIYRSVEFIVDFFRSTPATALFPLFLLLFGLWDLAKIAVAAFAAWLVIVFNVAYGVMNARQTRILPARSMGALSLRIFVM